LNGVGPRMDVYDRTLIASLVRTHAVVFWSAHDQNQTNEVDEW
jgi:hypothetical protein